MTERIPISVFAKPPRPGTVKTRLVPAVGELGAQALARAFFQDTWSAVRGLSWGRPILATTEPDVTALGASGSVEVWLQGDGDLGARMERILSRALREAPKALAIGADTPGLPLRLIEAARAALDTAEAVLGPSGDGGFYLIGLRRCPAGILAGLPWSEPTTLARTRERLRQHDLRVVEIEPWFDVDRAEDLSHLRAILAAGTLEAAETARVLESLFGPSRGAP